LKPGKKCAPKEVIPYQQRLREKIPIPPLENQADTNFDKDKNAGSVNMKGKAPRALFPPIGVKGEIY
jgi:hypothetical protein